MNTKNYIQTSLICPECGNETKIFRRKGKKREFFHHKDLYCPVCKQITKQIEIHDKKIAVFQLMTKSRLTDEEKKVYDYLTCEPKKVMKKTL
ncbi:MAG TPA: hypothetical protein IAB58_03855 [Candidatus Pelethosoma merdigallinarum]|nr:hypothetical protein [Candidatus Pelethosoma merdigallinarum]